MHVAARGEPWRRLRRFAPVALFAFLPAGPGWAIDYLLRTAPPAAGASVLVDGRPVATTDRGGKAVLPGIAPGEHLVALVSDGREIARSTLAFDARLNLVRMAVPGGGPSGAAASARAANVREIDYLVDANVPGAQVFVDGSPRGETSTPDAKAVLRLPLGTSHRIRLEKTGFSPFEQVVRVEEIGNRLVARLVPLAAVPAAGSAGPVRDARGGTLGILVGALGSLVAGTGIVFVVLLVARRRQARAETGSYESTTGRFVATSFDRYRLEAILGQGGVATIYRATDAQSGQSVALKVLDPKWLSDPEMVQKFLAEAEALAAIHRLEPDAPVVRLLRSGREGGRLTGCPFLALELLTGEDLERRLERGGPLPELEAVGIGVQIARALDVVHRAGIVHRDLTPDNVFVVPGDVRIAGRVYQGVPRVVLIDFGVARQEFLSRRTMDGSIAGKPPYMSPEQCRGARVDAKSDLYAFGLLLYALETGRPPFHGRNPFEVMRMQEQAAPPSLGGRFQFGYESLVLQLLEKSPADRPGSAAAVAAHLERHFAALAPHMIPALRSTEHV